MFKKVHIIVDCEKVLIEKCMNVCRYLCIIKKMSMPIVVSGVVPFFKLNVSEHTY